MRDLANLNLEVGMAILGGKVGTREGVAATGSFRETRRVIVEGQKIGYEKHVLDHSKRPKSEEDKEALQRRKKELEAELRALEEGLS